MLLNLEEYSVGEAPHSRTAKATVNHRELQRMLRYCLNRGLDRQRETLPKLRADVVIPCTRVQQVLIRLWCPDDRKWSRFLKKARPDLLPRDYIGRAFLMPGDAVIELRPLRIRQRCRVRFQALPDRIQQFGLLRGGQAIDLASQIVHTLITLARFLRSGKQLMRARCAMPDPINTQKLFWRAGRLARKVS
jgi:hypothetical protein